MISDLIHHIIHHVGCVARHPKDAPHPLAPRDRDEDGLSLGSLGRIVARLAPLEQAFQKMFTYQRSFSSQRSSMYASGLAWNGVLSP